MKCADARELLGHYIDRELAESVMQRIEKHLLRCAACAYEVRSIEQAREMLRLGVDQPMVSEQTGERILQQIASRFTHLHQAAPLEQPLSLPHLLEDQD